MLNAFLLDGVAYTGIKYLNIEASNLKTVWGAHKSLGRCAK